MLLNILLVGAGGALGALSRYGISTAANRFLGTQFAWGTFGANILGCLIIGFLFAWIEVHNFWGPSEKLFFMAGFLGAMTTFSTYALESIRFAQTGALGLGITNVVANHVVGLCSVLIGMWLGNLRAGG